MCMCVCVGSWVWFMGVCASHADEMKNGGRLNYMCLQNTNPTIRKGCMCSSLPALHVALIRPQLYHWGAEMFTINAYCGGNIYWGN